MKSYILLIAAYIFDYVVVVWNQVLANLILLTDENKRQRYSAKGKEADRKKAGGNIYEKNRMFSYDFGRRTR